MIEFTDLLVIVIINNNFIKTFHSIWGPIPSDVTNSNQNNKTKFSIPSLLTVKVLIYSFQFLRFTNKTVLK